MSVLAHVVSHSLAPEPAATQALGYILGDAAALRAFVKQLPRLGESEWSGVDKVWADLEKWADDLWIAGPCKCVPLRLRTGVERDAVVDDAADQMEVIARKIVDGLNSE